MAKKNRFWNIYLTAAVSVTLLLTLIGLECVLILSAGAVVKRIKENIALTIVLNETADSTAQKRLERMLNTSGYYSNYRYISAEEALQEHIEALGEDPTDFLGYNPLTASYEVHPTAKYAHPDSIAVLQTKLSSLPYVEQVFYQRDLVQLMNSNVSYALIALFTLALLLLLIALVLISNTIRLQIYSQRFLINTMTLVGATFWAIRAPYVKRYMRMGLCTALIAICLVIGGVYMLKRHMGIVLFAYNWQNIAFIAVVILLFGLLITFLASFTATAKYVRMNGDIMYEI